MFSFPAPAWRGHVDLLESVEGSDGVLLLLEADQDELWDLTFLDDGMSLGDVRNGAKPPELVQDSQISGPIQNNFSLNP